MTNDEAFIRRYVNANVVKRGTAWAVSGVLIENEAQARKIARRDAEAILKVEREKVGATWGKGRAA